MRKNKFLIALLALAICANVFADGKKFPKPSKNEAVCVMKIEFENNIDKTFFAETFGVDAESPDTCFGFPVNEGFFAVNREIDKNTDCLVDKSFNIVLFGRGQYISMPFPEKIFCDGAKYIYVGTYRISLDNDFNVKMQRLDEFDKAQKWLAEQLGKHADLIRAF